MHPENQWDASVARRRPEDSLRPRQVTNGHIDLALSQQPAKLPARAPNRKRSPRTDFTEQVDRHPTRRKLGAQTRLEAECEFLFERRENLAIAGQRDEHRLDTAVEIPGAYMKNAHQQTPAQEASPPSDG
jgi:hypothetical protein